MNLPLLIKSSVVLDTTKVQIFKQITTRHGMISISLLLFQIPQRYRFSSKSQQHFLRLILVLVVLDTTKVQIFKQITTKVFDCILLSGLFQIPQRYRFLSNTIEKHADKGVRESSIIIPQTWYFLDNQGVKGMINRYFEALFEINTI